jgi:hypothetical protein
MKWMTWLGVPVLPLLAIMGLARISAREEPAGNGKDSFQAQTVWKGEIRQDGQIFPTMIYVTSRNGARVRGEIHFRTSSGLCKLTFQGNVVDGRRVVWITDKKSGNVTYPGLYLGKIEGNRITGVWQVPSADQYDSFSVSLSQVERPDDGAAERVPPTRRR